MDNVEKIDLAKVDWKSSREFFESLGDALDKLDNKDESYDFTWVGKRKSIIEAGTPINKTLRPDIKASKNFDDTKNMLIVGDNLDALKLLQESYLGKIKMIYIDPPYNTGHDFVYHDNFTVKKADFVDSSTNSEGRVVVAEDDYAENSKANGRFHSDWLSMMYPRLKLARNLLADDGAIFISIDDNEYANLKKICDEIFGEENYRNTLAVRRRIKSLNAQFAAAGLKSLNIGFEYILIYSRTPAYVMPEIRVKKENASEKGRWDVFWSGADRPTMRYDILGFTPTTGQWRNSKEKAMEGVKNYQEYLEHYSKDMTIEEYSAKTGITYFIRRIENGTGKNGGVQHWVAPSSDMLRNTNWLDLEVSQISKEIDLPFDNPKNKLLVKEVLKFTDKDSIILDFFAGSGTTGHAAMELNADDGGNRRYILVQLNEETNDREARAAGFDSVDMLTAERLRRAGDKVVADNPKEQLDIGFRVLRVDGENEKTDIHKALAEIKQEELFNYVDNIKSERSPLDLLFGVICISALPFDLKLERRNINGNEVYLYGFLGEGSGLAACFDANVSEATIKEIAKLNVLTAVFKDNSFVDSAAKINLSEQFRVISPDTKVKVI